MPVLYKASFGYLRRHPWQLGLALLGIAVGVAVMVAVDLANASSRKAFRLSMDAINGAATHQIIGGPEGVDERLYADLRVRHGLRAVAPLVEGYVDLNGRTLRVLGVDLFAERNFRAYSMAGGDENRLIAGGGRGLDRSAVSRLLTEPGALLMTAATATSLNLATNDSLTITAAGKDFPASLVGAIDSHNGGGLDELLIVDIATAQSWFATPGYLTRIDVRLDGGEERAEWIRSLLPPGVQLLSAESRTATTTEMSSAFMTNLTAMSLLALLVGIFLIYNSVAFAVLQRRGLIGVLRALGLTRGQTFVLIMNEGVILGVVGSALGVVAGIWLGERLLVLVAQSINDLYFRVNVTDIALSPVSVAKGFLAGLGATVVAAAVPAIEASGFRPQLALARSVLEHRASALLPRLALAGVAAVLIAAAVLRLSGSSLVAGLVALFLLIVGYALCVPIAVKAISRMAAPLASKVGGTSARLAVSGIGASLSRTGVAIVALAVAVSVTVGVSVMVDSFRSAVGEWLGNTLRSDVYVGVPGGSLDPALVDDLVLVPGVGDYSTSRRAWLETGSGRTRLIVLKMAAKTYSGTRLLDAEPDEVWRAFEEEGAVVVSEPYAYRHGVGRGDTLTLPTGRGPRGFLVAATYRSYDADQGAVLMSRNIYRQFWNDDRIDSIGVYLEDGVSSGEVMARMRAVAEGRQAVLMRSNREIREMSLGIFDRTFIITDVLYWLAVGVAIVGILGAMLALQLERARELAVLRALGMTPGQLGGMVILQTSLIGCLSGLAAIPLGLVMARVLIDVINRRAFGWRMDFQVEPSILLAALGLAIAAAFAAGLYPAFRAARSQPALAMREE